MPNHVEQDLIITGNTELIKEFIEFAREDDNILSANKFIPYPEQYRILDELGHRLSKLAIDAKGRGISTIFTDGFNSGGYEWCCKNWGTKWGLYSATIISSKFTNKNGRVKYFCKSAWSPALPVFDAMSKKFLDLKFDIKYFERGMGFQGHYTCYHGDTIINERYAYRGRRGG